MAGVFKRKSGTDRGKSGKWTGWYFDEAGKQRQFTGTTDKKGTLEIARTKEADARLVREGIVDPGAKLRHAASLRAIDDHVEDYKSGLLAKGDQPKHAKHIDGALKRIFKSASIASPADISPDRIQEALGRMKVKKSARTCNHALRAVHAFVRWMVDAGRLKEVPRGIARIPFYPEESDRKLVRRALTTAELAKLLEATEQGPTIVTRRKGRGGKPSGSLTGPERAILYRIVMATGFRADEVRTLTPERFHLEGDSPSITVLACYSKRGKRSGRDDVQPIRRADAELLKPWLATREPGVPVLPVPEKTAEMLAADLGRAKIPVKDAKDRVLDFHALRHSYITHLVASGVNPKIVQKLARHSTITLTLDRYTHLEDGDLRGALEGGNGDSGKEVHD